jgi:glycosyltransferase involved in cell wall biosynthesis
VDTAKFSPCEHVRKDGSVLFVGRLLPHKGIDDLIKAVPSDMPLEIIGRPTEPRYFDDLRALAEGKRVMFRTACSDEQMIEAYRRATCVVLPSVYQTMYGDKTSVPELLGQTLLEGMACGTPAICTDVASMPEVVEDRVTGFVVPPNNPEALREKLLWIRDHSAEACAMGQAARCHVLEKFTWPAVVRRCLDIYNAKS